MKQKKLRNYLEIGVFNGHIFFRIRSPFKIAVDPDFQFDFLRKAGKVLLNPYNLYNQYFEETSDDFFKKDAVTALEGKKIEISLIDGMHEYAYVLRDIENTLEYLSDDGVIVVHDCNALTAEAGSSYMEWSAKKIAGTWNGDVWKAIVHLRSLRNDVDVFVLDCDQGLGIITKRKPAQMLSYTKEEISKLTFSDLEANRERWLNLKPESYLKEYFELK